MKFDFICDNLPDGLVLMDEAFFGEFNEDMLYSFEIWLKEREIGACLSNSHFMFGHFIEARWDDKWNLVYSGIC